jgi:hypothetical protein
VKPSDLQRLEQAVQRGAVRITPQGRQPRKRHPRVRRKETRIMQMSVDVEHAPGQELPHLCGKRVIPSIEGLGEKH